MSVDGRFSDQRLVAFTEIKTPLPSGGFALVQSAAFGERIGDCNRATFEMDKLDRTLGNSADQ